MRKDKNSLIQPPISPLSGGLEFVPPLTRGGLRRGCIKKLAILGFALLILVGFFVPLKTQAETRLQNCLANPGLYSFTPENAPQRCPTITDSNQESTTPGRTTDPTTPFGQCVSESTSAGGSGEECRGLAGDTQPPRTNGSDFENYVRDHGCGLGIFGHSSIWPGCFLTVSYGLFYVIPSGILWISAYFFNLLISITLGSELFSKSVFIPQAWAVVRDLSNIFFIFILLYVAIRTIVGSGVSEVKKIVVQIIIMAILINFSMFFSKIIIDSANIVALIFYNKVNVTTTQDGKERLYESIYGEKDVAGSMVNAFNPTSLLTAEFFAKAGEQHVPGQPTIQGEASAGIIILITLLTGGLMFYAAYSFIIVGLSFISRLIELWVLIIFSPFAFMSSVMPFFAKIEAIGWDEWLKRLLKVSFMAPVFMFFLYMIFLLIKANPFNNIVQPNQSMEETILLVILPALMILIILHKATEKAQKASGELGGMIIGVGKAALGVATGLAVGGGIGLAAKGLQGTVGQLSSRVANSATAKRWETEGRFGAGALRSVAKFGGTSSFDLRKGVGGTALKGLGTMTGLSMGHDSKLWAEAGGFEADRKKKVEKRQTRMKDLEVGEDEGLKQDVRGAEVALQAAKTDPATQEALVRLNNGSQNEQEVAAANTAVDVANAAMAPAQALVTNQATAQNNLNVANNALANNPGDQALIADQVAAINALDAATQALAEAQTLVTNQTVAQNALVANPADPVLQQALNNANNALVANPAAQAMANQNINLIAREAALQTQAATQGLGALERAATAGQRGLADAERRLKDAIAQFGTNSTQANTARAAQATAEAERERTRINLENRQGAIRTAGAGIHNAEVALTRAKNAETGENNRRRRAYAGVVGGGGLPAGPGPSLLQTVSFLNAGGEAAQTEARNKILAGIQEAKKESSH